MAVKAGLVLALAGLLAGCASAPPANPNDICSIFAEKKAWRKAALASERRWGTPVHIQMAIIRQESRFDSDARPPRKKVLGIIPGGRRSSAYGYAQAKDGTWDWYRTNTGNRRADRAKFADAVDFVGWYTHQSQRMAGISKWDPYNQYLAYHEGQTGFKRGTFKNKHWLMKVAKRVDTQARQWGAQLKSCR